MLTQLALWLLLFPTAQAKDEPSPEPPPEGPISATLIARNKTFKLDLQGKTVADFETAIKNGTIDAPAVDWQVELRNNTKGEVRIRTAGLYPKFTFSLTGKGSGSTGDVLMKDTTRKATTYATLKPGKTTRISIPRLESNGRLRSRVNRHYWTQAGDYSLSLTLRVAYYVDSNPVGKGVKGRVTYLNVTTDPIKIKVTEK